MHHGTSISERFSASYSSSTFLFSSSGSPLAYAPNFAKSSEARVSTCSTRGIIRRRLSFSSSGSSANSKVPIRFCQTAAGSAGSSDGSSSDGARSPDRKYDGLPDNGSPKRASISSDCSSVSLSMSLSGSLSGSHPQRFPSSKRGRMEEMSTGTMSPKERLLRARDMLMPAMNPPGRPSSPYGRRAIFGRTTCSSSPYDSRESTSSVRLVLSVDMPKTCTSISMKAQQKDSAAFRASWLDSKTPQGLKSGNESISGAPLSSNSTKGSPLYARQAQRALAAGVMNVLLRHTSRDVSRSSQPMVACVLTKSWYLLPMNPIRRTRYMSSSKRTLQNSAQMTLASEMRPFLRHHFTSLAAKSYAHASPYVSGDSGWKSGPGVSSPLRKRLSFNILTTSSAFRRSVFCFPPFGVLCFLVMNSPCGPIIARGP